MITAKAIWTDNERYIGEASSHHAIVMDTATRRPRARQWNWC